MRRREREEDDDGAFRLDLHGCLYWREDPVAYLAAGESPLAPRIVVRDSEFLDGPARERIRQRAEAWLKRFLKNRLGALYALEQAPLQGAARGLASQPRRTRTSFLSMQSCWRRA